ncbi:MAG: hypothetical protein BWY89_01851 [Bacteroidetes bacterium ADurb.BinA012]|nr:MAG: hypothetical protein BWY89_01851 [Bacteroidetes bacterium ADurb.BinA012]
MTEVVAVAGSMSTLNVATMVGLTGTFVGDVAPLRSIVPAMRDSSASGSGSFLQLVSISENAATTRSRLVKRCFSFIKLKV